MKKILAATDFSTRSDRALRRATLLAKRHDAEIVLVHVVDDDQPQRILRAEQKETSEVLEDLARTVREVDGVQCQARVVLGDPFEGIIKTGDEIAADLIVMGEHRRQTLGGVFVGTTAERTIRADHRPVLVVAALPAAFYRHILIATDLSNASRDAIRVVMQFEMNKHAAISVVHVFDAIGAGLMSRASLSAEQIQDYIDTERDRAYRPLSAFIENLGIDPMYRMLKANEPSISAAICSAAREVSADLIVVGTHSRTGIQKLLLGSVAENVVRDSENDVLAVPPQNLP